ncbi:diguanylate cyclase [Magnetovibrio sp.]|uniref:sensor domain-containing diguanylate cyclase n=1 Tax=Magnetovibrio sp. TaxID=2024836 RepID=UPI002F926407
MSIIKTPIASRWNTISSLAMVLIVATAIGGVYIGANAIRLFSDMRATWHHYDQVSEQKITYLTQMHQYLGYSGFAQHLKDYLLHGKDHVLTWIDIDLDQAKNAIDSYRLLEINEAETAALDDLKALVLKSRAQVQEIPKLRQTGMTPAQIDTRIDLNPDAAIAALDQLRWAWRQQAGVAEQALNETSDTGANLVYFGWVFIPVMGVIGLIVFGLVNRLRSQITAYEREKAALETSERKFRDMAANVPGVIFQWYERRGGERGYLYVSPRCKELYGVSAAELQRNWQALSIHPDDEERYLKTVQDAFEKRTDWSFEGRFLTPSGEEKWWRGISKPVPVSDEEIVFNGMIIDISLQKKMEEELRALATTDGLTGAYNRRHFIYEASTEVPRAKRYGHPLSVLMIDLDFFKKINDAFGHAGGDEVLRRFVTSVKSILRGPDVLGRIGGEEFALMLPETDLVGAIALAERIRSDIQDLNIRWDKRTIKVTASIGVAMLQKDDTDIHAIMAKADKALYTAKAEGRNRVMVSGGTVELSADAAPELIGLTATGPGPHGAN